MIEFLKGKADFNARNNDGKSVIDILRTNNMSVEGCESRTAPAPCPPAFSNPTLKLGPGDAL